LAPDGIPKSPTAYWTAYSGDSWDRNWGSRRGFPSVGSMYINAGNAAYNVSTAFTRLNDIKFSFFYDEKTIHIGSPWYLSTNILHEHHYI
jgi:hypothetical protein